MGRLAKRCGPVPAWASAALLAAGLCHGSGPLADPPAEGAHRGSVSIGTPMGGSLLRGEVLPRKGAGYEMLPATSERRARFGVSELVALVKKSAFRVRRKHPASLLLVGDLSTRRGGPIENHGSHQSGRDVDFLFYVTDPGGAPVANEGFVPFDGNGFSVDPPMRYRFDARRNWALVEALLSCDEAEVQWIFVADHLKDILLSYAVEAGAPRGIVAKARSVLHQPSKKAHWDHFHVRIYCPAGDRPECDDVGPRWAWAR